MNIFTRLFLDPVAANREKVPRRFQFTGDFRAWFVPMGIGGALLVIALVLGLSPATEGMQRFLFAYLVAWMFCVSISIGALFFVMFHHITKARWSTTVRRISELLVVNFPLLAVAGLPVLFGVYDLYHWSHADLYSGPHADAVLIGKAPYFFFPLEAGGFPLFWVARYVVYFAILSYLGLRLYALSVKNDTEPRAENTHAQRKLSAWGIPVTSLITAFVSYDYLMSLEPHWFSTMFGVYFWAGGWLAALCLITCFALWFKNRGMVDEEITREHIQDLGKYMFAFVVFWIYIAFSQFMLYWYGNLPEEIVWFLRRLEGDWRTVSLVLIYVHFILPFLILLPRFVKRSYPLLGVMAVWLLAVHWVDLWWISAPAMIEASHNGGHAAAGLVEQGQILFASLQQGAVESGHAAAEGVTFHVVPPEATLFVGLLAWLGMFGLYAGVTILRASRHALTPYGDPYFEESLRFENV